MTIQQDVIKAETPAYIELFIVDCSIIAQPVYYFTNTESSIIWGSAANTFIPFPLELTGFEVASANAPARPTLSISNLQDIAGNYNKFVGNLAFLYDDLVGVKVTYIRTFESYINAGIDAGIPTKYEIAKKISHNRLMLSFELRSPLDKERGYLPKRQMLNRDFPGLSVNKHVG